MFQHAVAFEQNLGGWNITLVADMSSMFTGAGLSVDNYDALLIGWAARASAVGVRSDVPFDAGSSMYSCAVIDDRDVLTGSPNLWTIDDAGQSDTPGPPMITSILPGNTVLTVTFVDGCAGPTPTVAYEVSVDGGATWNPATPTADGTIVLTGLTNGRTYPVRLRADSAFPGPASEPVDGTPSGAMVPAFTG